MVESAVLVGLDDGLIDRDSLEAPVHRDLVAPLQNLRRRAEKVGFQLAVASGYRSFERQLMIWNAKAEGARPVLDDNGQPLDTASLSETQLLFAILRWSALPGASRHHWGTDVDVYDQGPSRQQGYRVQLTYEETREGGIYAGFHRWLDRELAREPAAFFRPYTRWHGGVAPEPWHLSYAPLSAAFEAGLEAEHLYALMRDSDIALKQAILEHFDEIYCRFVQVNPEQYPKPWRPDSATVPKRG